MSLLDKSMAHPAVLELRVRTHVPRQVSYSSTCRRHVCAKVKSGEDKQNDRVSNRGFPLRVPTMPDIESARRLLESAFQALSFDMPRIPINSALQGLPFGISKSMQVLVFDITGFVVTKLKRPEKKALEDVSLDKNQYPRCAWPRVRKEALMHEVIGTRLLEDPEELEASYRTPVGPHCAWPRTHCQSTEASGSSSPQNIVGDVLYPHSAWPRTSFPANHMILTGQQLVAGSPKVSATEDEGCVIEGGARCAWPRKGISAKQSQYNADNAENAGRLDVSQPMEDVDAGKVPRAEVNEAGLLRRMLATGVGLSVLDQLAKGSIATSIFDFCSLLPAGPLEISEEEDVAMDVGRRTLLVFIKGSGE